MRYGLLLGLPQHSIWGDMRLMRVKARSQEDLEWKCKPTKMGMARAMTLINFQGTSSNRWVCSHTIVVIPFLCYYGKGQCAKSFHCYIVDEIRSLNGVGSILFYEFYDDPGSPFQRRACWDVLSNIFSELCDAFRLFLRVLGSIFSVWWFGTFFIFYNIWDNPFHWLIFFQDG